MSEVVSDEIYYRHGLKLPLATRAAIAARRNVFDRFMREIDPGETTKILDFGVSTTTREEANILEQNYPWTHRITCCGVGPWPTFNEEYPGSNYVSIIPGAPLPFPNRSFDVAYSNAVLEHIGSNQSRAHIITELMRVAHRIFIAVPNRWFPIEHHSGIPLLHYSPAAFRRVLRHTSLGHWSSPEHLAFIGQREISEFWPTPFLPNISYSGIGVGALSSNIVMWT